MQQQQQQQILDDNYCQFSLTHPEQVSRVGPFHHKQDKSMLFSCKRELRSTPVIRLSLML